MCARFIDEIEVAGNDTFFDDAKDAWIGTQVRSEMVLDPDIRAVNYMIQTENGSVYLIGMARTPRELQSVTDIARHVRGVKRVVSYVELRPGAPQGLPGGRRSDRRGPQPTPPLSTSPLSMSPPASRPALRSCRTPIAVEKL